MGRKKGKGPKRATDSYQNLIATQSAAKYEELIAVRLQPIVEQFNASLAQILPRLQVLENILIKKYKDVTKDSLSHQVAALQDEVSGFVQVDRAVQLNDRVRIAVAAKKKEEKEYPKDQRLMVDNIGSGETISKEIEDKIVGMKIGETKEIPYNEGATVVKIKLEGVSELVKEEVKKDDKATATSEPGAKSEETSAS